MNNVADLSLEDLKKGLPGVTPVLGNFHAQACLVCFYERKHTSGVKLETKGTFASVFAVNWQDAITDQILQAWGDPEVATEQAAYGIAFLLVLKLTPFTVIRKSKKGTGFDYWLGKQSTIDELPFQDMARLEVSGIREADTENDIKKRIKTKTSQTKPSDNTNLPAYIIVVEFSRPLAYVVEK